MGFGITLLSRQTKPLCCLYEIFRNAFAVFVGDANIVLRLHVPLFASLAPPFDRLSMIPKFEIRLPSERARGPSPTPLMESKVRAADATPR